MRAIVSGDKGSFEIEQSDGLATSERMIRVEGENLLISDGYHTMDELYAHRIELFITLCRVIVERNKMYATQHGEKRGPILSIWRAELHADGTMYEGQFILGIGKENRQQLTYHLPRIKWDEVSFAMTLEHAPAFDGHTSQDVLKRLQYL